MRTPGRPSQRLAHVLIVMAIAVAGLFTFSGAASAAGSPVFNPIVNAANGKCLDVVAEDGYYNIGARVQQYHCTGAQEQKWRVVRINPINGYNTWEIISQRSGLCLGRQLSAADRVQVMQLPCDGTANIGWYIGTFQNGDSDMVSVFDGRILDVDSNSAADHAKIQVYTYNGGTAQRWRSISFSTTR